MYHRNQYTRPWRTIAAVAFAPEGYFTWNLASDAVPINESSSQICTNLPLPYSSGLVVLNLTTFTNVRVRLITTNLAVTKNRCHSIPLLLLINTSSDSLASGECRPFCGPLATCSLENQLDDLTIWNCHCPGEACHQIALAIAPGAFVDYTISAKICHLDLIYIWNSLIIFLTHLPLMTRFVALIGSGARGMVQGPQISEC